MGSNSSRPINYVVELHLNAHGRTSIYTNEHGFDVHSKNIEFSPELTYATMLDVIRDSFKMNAKPLPLPLRLDYVVPDTRKNSTKEISFMIDDDTNLLKYVFGNINVLRLVASEIDERSSTNGIATPKSRLPAAKPSQRKHQIDISVRSQPTAAPALATASNSKHNSSGARTKTNGRKEKQKSVSSSASTSDGAELEAAIEDEKVKIAEMSSQAQVVIANAQEVLNTTESQPASKKK